MSKRGGPLPPVRPLMTTFGLDDTSISNFLMLSGKRLAIIPDLTYSMFGSYTLYGDECDFMAICYYCAILISYRLYAL